ncbi:DUF6545 domain-containing protein [Rhodococcus qingshengii]|uniref:DUF6545 domain-containing protein n=1 Tax=Rhodococcus qingshengii TaxID=334542 RepID=A0A2A5IXN5_RHOSG|nr:DUF6545 domain-containing protein [Rhodococcus qingshengii]PCK22013.1 hypothetical protein CHR55_33290 [Rhodococcus qingshengii]
MWHSDRLPVWLTLACLGAICFVVLVHVPLVRKTTADKQINQIAIWGAITALLREPAVAQWIAPGETLLLNDIWHFTLLMTTTSAVGLFMLHHQSEEEYRRRYPIWVATTYVSGVLFVLLSRSARERGMLVQDALGWQYGAYFMLYGAMTIAACLYAMWIVPSAWRKAADARDKAILVTIFLICSIGAGNMAVLAFGAVIASAGVDDAFTRDTEVRASGEFLLLFIGAAALLTVWSSSKALAALFRVDHDSRMVRFLQPVWRDLAETGTPEVVLRLSREDRAKTSDERLRRRRTEIHDSIAIISRYVQPLDADVEAKIEASVPDELQESVLSAVELIVTARYLKSIGGKKNAGEAPNPPSSADPIALVEVWPLARKIAGTIDSGVKVG